jgi:hypothetical protein
MSMLLIEFDQDKIVLRHLRQKENGKGISPQFIFDFPKAEAHASPQTAKL